MKESPNVDRDTTWWRIPDGVRVRDVTNGEEGIIDGVTHIVKDARLNPDRLTQYRVDVGTPYRKLAPEEDLAILLDDEGLIIISKQPAEYRRYVTTRLLATRPETRFMPRNAKAATRPA
ncbi:hypothetical protein [Candidatus Nitrospira bockiana]